MKQKTLLVALGSVVGAALLGTLVGMRVKSPGEAAAQTAPPKASPILVPAEMRELSSDVITRGTGRYGAGQKLALAPTTLKNGERTATSVPTVGRMVKEGESAMSVSGRPVHLMTGSTPSYRDLGPGMSGRDVRQLEASLARVGLNPGAVDGVFDSATEAAVARLYSRSGSTPFRATQAQLNATRPVESNFVPGGRARAGIQVPADEIIFVPSFPVRVSEVHVELGKTIDGAVLTVTNTMMFIDSAVSVEQAQLVKVGKEVFIDEPDLNIKGKGVVTTVASGPGTNGVGGYNVYFQVRVVQAPSTIIKASVRLRVPVTSTGKKVLAVPVTAVTLAADGTSRIQKKAGEGFEFVTVTPRLSAGGYVEIEVTKGTLKPGDLVVVGYEKRDAGSRG